LVIPSSRPGTRCLGIEHLAAILPNGAAWVPATTVFAFSEAGGGGGTAFARLNAAATLRETRMRMKERSTMPADPMGLRRIGGSVRELHVRELH
jgi:hypothetical protein